MLNPFNQSFNQAINQSINQSNQIKRNQIKSKSFQSIKSIQSIIQSVSQSINQSLNQSINQSNQTKSNQIKSKSIQSINQIHSINHSISQSINQSFNQSINQIHSINQNNPRPVLSSTRASCSRSEAGHTSMKQLDLTITRKQHPKTGLPASASEGGRANHNAVKIKDLSALTSEAKRSSSALVKGGLFRSKVAIAYVHR